MSQRTLESEPDDDRKRPNSRNRPRTRPGNRRNNRRNVLAGFLGCGGLLVLFVIVAGGFYLFTVIAPVEAQLPNKAVPILVNLTRPFQGDNVSLTDYNTVRADAIGATPVQVMQLWVDGVPVDAHAATANGSTYAAEFSWLPTGPGDHTLLVVAVDANGQSVNSNLLQVKAFPPEPTLLEVPVIEGGTLQTVAQAFDLTPDQVIALNPQITTAADQPLPAGTVLTVLPPSGAPNLAVPKPAIPPDTSLLPPLPQPPTGPVAAAPSLPTNNPAGLFTKLVVAPSATRPAAPQLSANVEGCNVTLYFTDQANDETGFLVYRANPGSATFTKIAALDASANTGTTLSFSEPGRYGRSMYYISAFNGAGESQSNPAQATLFSQTCVQPDQVGLAVKTPKITTANPLERAFCYAALDNGSWQRMPKGVETYVYPVNGVFDFSKDLNTLVSPPPTVAVTLSMRCGGFAGDALIDLGVGQQTIQPNSNNAPFELKSEGFTLTAILNFGQSQVPPAPPVPPPLTKPEKIIPPTFDVAVIPDPLTDELNVLWRWRPVTCPPDASGNPPADCKYVSDITGYRVINFGGEVVKDGLPPNQKLFKLPPGAADEPVACFAVVAYKGALISEAPGNTSLGCYINQNFPTPSLYSANISAPTNLRLTSDIKECQRHQETKPVDWGGQDCQKIIGSQGRAMVWDWSNTLCQPGGPGCQAIADIEGYHFYTSTSYRDGLLMAVTPATTKALVFLSSPENNSANCFEVRAFKGNLESNPSNEICLSPAELGLTNFTLDPTIAYKYGSYFNKSGCNPESSQQVDTPDKGSLYRTNEFNVGYIHRSFSGLFGVGNVTACPETTAFWREGVVKFDLTTMVGRTIQKATFEFQRGQAQNLWAADQIFPDGFLDMGLDTDNNCATSLRTDVHHFKSATYINGKRTVSGTLGMFEGATEVAPAPLGTAPIDVTALANQVITSNKFSLAFLFATDESHPDETKSCFSSYHDFS